MCNLLPIYLKKCFQDVRIFQQSECHSPSATAPESLTRHPLQCRWALWYLKADRNKDWEDCLKQVAVFDTVEDFWA